MLAAAAAATNEKSAPSSFTKKTSANRWSPKATPGIPNMRLAQSAKLGIWKNPHIESPFCFRHKRAVECVRGSATVH